MKICFWGACSGALLNCPLGGGEMQIALLARALKRAGHEVVLVDYSIPEDFETAEGIKVICIKGYNKGIRIFRALFSRFRLIYESLKAQKADIYYCRIRDFRHILAFWAAHKVQGKFILALASDIDTMSLAARFKYLYSSGEHSFYLYISGLLSELVYPWLLRHSDLILVQHEGQKEKLQQKGIKSKILSNIIDLKEIPVVNDPVRTDFIYVGALRKRKGFLKFFELIKKAPMHKFKIIGETRDDTGLLYYNKLKAIKNVALFGRLNHSETLYQIMNSKALISTSPVEGFPNIFLEAWATGAPVMSLYVDPGNIIEKEKLGIVAKGDVGKLLKEMSELIVTDEMQERLKSYVDRHHVLNEIRVKEVNRLFLSVLDTNNSTEIKNSL